MLTLAGMDTLSDCPGCGGRDFVRASLFSAGGLGAGGLARGHAGAAEAGSHRGPILAARGGASASRAERTAGAASPLETGGLGGALSRPEPVDGEDWLQRARELIAVPGEHLAYEEGGELKTVALTREWTRIGRSLAADVRFDDPTVSRRHALVVRQADGVRVLDDRSLNGVFVNGSRVERRVLRDGDEILVGRYRLRFLSIAPDAGEAPASTTTLHSAG
jgi:hypothetical protein